jgi:hypothetical protein
MKYNGSEWVDATGSDLPTATYTYSFRNKDGGVITDYSGQNKGKAIYIDGELVNKNIVIDVAVTV